MIPFSIFNIVKFSVRLFCPLWGRRWQKEFRQFLGDSLSNLAVFTHRQWTMLTENKTIPLPTDCAKWLNTVFGGTYTKLSWRSPSPQLGSSIAVVSRRETRTSLLPVNERGVQSTTRPRRPLGRRPDPCDHRRANDALVLSAPPSTNDLSPSENERQRQADQIEDYAPSANVVNKTYKHRRIFLAANGAALFKKIALLVEKAKLETHTELCLVIEQNETLHFVLWHPKKARFIQ